MSVSKTLRFKVFLRDHFTCRYCGRRAPDVVLHADHVHPVSRGGKDHIDNLVTACADCNQSKQAKLLPLDAVQAHAADKPHPDRCRSCGRRWVSAAEEHRTPDGRGFYAHYACPKCGHAWRTFWSDSPLNRMTAEAIASIGAELEVCRV